MKTIAQNSLSIVVPVYNSVNSIELLVNALVKELTYIYPESYEILLVNDGSKDNSWQAIQHLCKKFSMVRGINLFRNFGQINALMAGFSNVKGKYVIIMDDDLQNPPEEIHKIIKALEAGSDFVFAIPDQRQDSIVRRFFSYVNEMTLNYFANKPKDIKISSYLGMTYETVYQIRKYSGPFPYLAGMLFKVTTNGQNIKVRHQSRTLGTSNYNLKSMILLYLSGLTNFSIIPLRLSLFFGSAIAFISLFYGFALVALKIFYTDFQLGWASVVVLISLLSGVILISLGVLGEYVGRIFSILNSHPQFIIRDSINLDSDF